MATPSNPKVASVSVSPAAGPERSTVVQTERKLEFMKERELPLPAAQKKLSAKVLAEHAAGAEALANYQ